MVLEEQIKGLEAKRDELITRLENGEVHIEEQRAAGQEVAELEDFWIELLKEYEEVCETLRTLQHGPKTQIYRVVA